MESTDVSSSFKDKTKFPRIGDVVKIINWGQLYSSYKQAARTMGLTKWKDEPNAPLTTSDYDSKFYTVLNDYAHSYTHERILGITNGTRDFVIGEKGVQVVGRAPTTNQQEEIIEPQKFDENNLYAFAEEEKNESNR